jgi:hypothetical protein
MTCLFYAATSSPLTSGPTADFVVGDSNVEPRDAVQAAIPENLKGPTFRARPRAQTNSLRELAASASLQLTPRFASLIASVDDTCRAHHISCIPISAVSTLPNTTRAATLCRQFMQDRGLRGARRNRSGRNSREFQGGLKSLRGIHSPYTGKRSRHVGRWRYDFRDRGRATVSRGDRKPPAGCGGPDAVFVGTTGADDDRHCIGDRGRADPTEIAEGVVTMLGLPPPIPMPVLLGILAVILATIGWYRRRY